MARPYAAIRDLIDPQTAGPSERQSMMPRMESEVSVIGLPRTPPRRPACRISSTIESQLFGGRSEDVSPKCYVGEPDEDMLDIFRDMVGRPLLA